MVLWEIAYMQGGGGHLTGTESNPENNCQKPSQILLYAGYDQKKKGAGGCRSEDEVSFTNVRLKQGTGKGPSGVRGFIFAQLDEKRQGRGGLWHEIPFPASRLKILNWKGRVGSHEPVQKIRPLL